MEGNVFFFDWEITLIEWLQAHIGYNPLIPGFFSAFGEEVIFILVFGLLYWCLDKKSAKIVGTSLMIGIIANPLIKNVALRRRPYFDNPGIKCLKPVVKDKDLYDIAAQGYSFPSAHSANSFVMYESIRPLLKNRVLRTITLVLPFLVGLSRVALGVHYPTDVLTGWVIGLLVIIVVPAISKAVKNENMFRLAVFIVSSFGILYCRTNDYYTGLGLMGGLFLAIPFEERFVSFSGTNRPFPCVLRVAGGLILEILLSTVTKLPFSKEFLESGTMPAYLIRAGRYALIAFVLFAIYPIVFNLKKEKG